MTIFTQKVHLIIVLLSASHFTAITLARRNRYECFRQTRVIFIIFTIQTSRECSAGTILDLFRRDAVSWNTFLISRNVARFIGFLTHTHSIYMAFYPDDAVSNPVTLWTGKQVDFNISIFKFIATKCWF